MKKIFITVTLLAAAFILLPSCAETNKDAAYDQMSRKAYYDDLVKDAVNASPKQLGIKLSDDEVSVYGVVMEQNVEGLLILASASYVTGEAVEIIYGGNCYVLSGAGGLSSGISQKIYATAERYLDYYGAEIEKYWKEQSRKQLSQDLLMTLFIEDNNGINDKIKELMVSAQNYLGNLTDVETDGSLPVPGEIKIVFLTNKGRFFVQGTIEQIKETTPDLAMLFQSRSNISREVFENYADIAKSNV